jgi:hypothetical protein
MIRGRRDVFPGLRMDFAPLRSSCRPGRTFPSDAGSPAHEQRNRIGEIGTIHDKTKSGVVGKVVEMILGAAASAALRPGAEAS